MSLCPECREVYPKKTIRHRFAEKALDELSKAIFLFSGKGVYSFGAVLGELALGRAGCGARLRWEAEKIVSDLRP